MAMAALFRAGPDDEALLAALAAPQTAGLLQ